MSFDSEFEEPVRLRPITLHPQDAGIVRLLRHYLQEFCMDMRLPPVPVPVPSPGMFLEWLGPRVSLEADPEALCVSCQATEQDWRFLQTLSQRPSATELLFVAWPGICLPAGPDPAAPSVERVQLSLLVTYADGIQAPLNLIIKAPEIPGTPVSLGEILTALRGGGEQIVQVLLSHGLTAFREHGYACGGWQSYEVLMGLLRQALSRTAVPSPELGQQLEMMFRLIQRQMRCPVPMEATRQALPPQQQQVPSPPPESLGGWIG